MKKWLLCIFMIVAVMACLCGCKTTPYNEAVSNQTKTGFAGGYFTTITEWRDDIGNYCIVYANDTKVKYLITASIYKYGITPLYNADGSLQVYDEDGD